MYKVILADDEQRIRRGLRRVVTWSDYDMEVICEASDGEMALKLVKEHQPDIILLDICMPFLTGLELVEALSEEMKENMLIVIVSGYDDFQYIQKALRLKVFDFLLKPLSKAVLIETLMKAKRELKTRRLNNKEKTMKDHMVLAQEKELREKFFQDMALNKVKGPKLKELLGFFKLAMRDDYRIVIMKVNEKVLLKSEIKGWDHGLLLFSADNIAREIMEPYTLVGAFKDHHNQLVYILSGRDQQQQDLKENLTHAMEKHLHHPILYYEKAFDIIEDFSMVYREGIKAMKEERGQIPVVHLATQYIEKNYHSDLSLEKLATKYKISTTYLSRLIKKETGLSFMDYVTHVRIRKAMELMKDPSLKLYEVAEGVGYHSQHYFSTAFKKVIGVSPLEHRKKLTS